MNVNARLSYEPIPQQLLWQNQQLKDLLGYLIKRSSYYQRVFKEHHINTENIQSVNDLSFLPTTSKQDLQSHNWEFLSVESAAIKEYAITPVKSEPSGAITLTQNDLQRLAYNNHQSLIHAGCQSNDIFQLILSLDEQLIHGISFYLGIRELGAASIRTAHLSYEAQWASIFQLQSNVLIANPFYLLEMIHWAREHNLNLVNTPLDKIICVGERIRMADFELNEIGNTIEQNLSVQVFNTYSVSEIQTRFTECSAGMGFHELPDLAIMEILDEKGQPLKPGSYGELTITTLGIEGMPLIRFRTGDICTFYETPCSCGRTSRRFSPMTNIEYN